MTGGVRSGVATLAVATVLLVGCGDDPTGDQSPAAGAGAAIEGTITVAAATSLTGAFTELADRFTAAHPGVDVTLAFDASSALAIQILEGAPADVVASADEAAIAALTAEEMLAGPPRVFATNHLVIVTEPGNPGGVGSLADLGRIPDDGVVSLCAAEVPCGRYAAQALAAAGVTLPEAKVTRGPNAAATLTAVTQGDAAAAIVYRTDARAAGDAVERVELPAELDVVARYPIGVLRPSDDRAPAEAFVAYVLSAEGQAVLGDHGFGRAR